MSRSKFQNQSAGSESSDQDTSLSLANHYTITLDDDPTQRRLIEKMTGLTSLPFTSATKLLEQASRLSPKVAFIDIHLDTEKGLDIVAELKAKWPGCPLIVMTSDPNEEALSDALALGADDFLRKPLQKTELLARIRARLGEKEKLLRKVMVQVGDITVNTEQRTLEGEMDSMPLSPTTQKLLLVLFQAQPMIVPKASLKQQVWGGISISDDSLAKALSLLRKALKSTTKQVTLRTIYGKGAKLSINKI